MKTLKILYLISVVLVLNTNDVKAQSDTSFILKSENFWKDPVYYFSKIDRAKLSTKILLDKVNFTNDIFDFNGISQVKTGRVGDLELCYKQLRKASFDTTIFQLPFAKFLDIYRSLSNYNGIVTIALLNINYTRIKPEAFQSGEFYETNGYLNDQYATQSSYENKRFFFANILDNRIHGDVINFNLDKSFYISNIKDEKITQIEIDFGDDVGFRNVNWNDPISIQYSPECEFIEAIMRIHVLKQDSSTNIYYSHFTFLHTGSTIVPDLSLGTSSGQKSAPNLSSKFQFYFPIGSFASHYETQYHWVQWLDENDVPCPCLEPYLPCFIPNAECINYTCYTYEPYSAWISGTAALQISILLNPSNTTYSDAQPKLRKPFIICDGFDPGNKRHWNLTNTTSTDEFADKRGIYELLNGNPSPRAISSGYPLDVNVVQKLQSLGYDIVVIDFIDGAGNILTNADRVKDCLNNVINTTWRDNNTEESVFVGPSMGGLISRLALLNMEQEEALSEKSHLVNNWISFDSPNKGASIPISLQYSIHFLTFINEVNFVGLTADDAKAGEAILSTTAAQQMLLYHFSQFGGEDWAQDHFGSGTSQSAAPHSDKSSLDIILNDNYPKMLQRTAISNGGKQKLFSGVGLMNTFLETPLPWLNVSGWNNHNSNGAFKIFEGNRLQESYSLYTNNQIGLDDAPGGFTDAQRSLNHSSANTVDFPSFNGTSADISTFMVTTSAFGVSVNQNNVYKIWDDSEANLTPFDVIHNMPGINEEHVMITQHTRDYISTLLENDLQNIQRPRQRGSIHEIQNIYQPVLFKAYHTATFGSNNGQDKFIVNATADVNVEASNSIIFKPGFRIMAGAKFYAKIKNATGITSAKVANTNTKSFNYLHISPYAEIMHDYSSKSTDITYLIKTKIKKENINIDLNTTINIYPNPANDIVNIDILKLGINSTVCIFLYDVYGKNTAIQINKISSSHYKLDCSNIAAGIYFLNIKINNDYIMRKLTLLK